MTFVLLPGAGGSAWSWHLVEPLLQAAGHRTIAVDLPADDVTAGLADYADTVVSALPEPAGPGSDLDGGQAGAGIVLAALSFGGFTAPLVAQRIPVAAIVLVNAMIPAPGERADDWWDASGARAARRARAQADGRAVDADPDDLFFHDIDPEVAARMRARDRDEASLAMSQPCDFEAWPAVPIHVLAGRDDRLFPPEFQGRLARERLGVAHDVIPGGHLLGLANPAGTAECLLAYRSAGPGHPLVDRHRI